MNQRQRAFCEAYLKCGNAAEAAIKAGYSPKSARSIGQRLLTFADIREYLAQRNAQIIAENTATLEEIYSFWTVTMRDQASKPADRLKASELLSKALIVERTRKENSDQSGAGHEFDGWSDEELRGAVHLMEDLSDEEFNAITVQAFDETREKTFLTLLKYFLQKRFAEEAGVCTSRRDRPADSPHKTGSRDAIRHL